MIKISRWIEPDFSGVVKIEKTYSENVHYELISVIFKESLAVIQRCDENGFVESSSYYTKYYGIRKREDLIEICIPKYGWIPIYEEVQKVYNEQIAERALLNGQI